ncbi:HAD hydrolase-like protein [Nesterenkonia sp. K-15-9-6]|uniref:HAD hydrolase-like protein n=1 Tax=Nesterenkonia sp. K-15-9-6 TaxID=3093918 RepID=UPI004044E7E6
MTTRPTSPALQDDEPSADDGAPLVLFDLDGTLVDPAGSITGGIAAALAAHGIDVPDQPTLEGMVGPPLAASLLSLPGVTTEMLPGLVAHYRAGYLAHGMAASKVYPGLRQLLADLRKAGVALAVATSKPQPLAERLLEVQGLAGAVDVVAGSDPDETVPHAGKAPILAAALRDVARASDRDPSGGPSRPRAAMVGDRIFDVEGAQAHGIPCVGVRWGSAPAGELEQAGADVVVDDAQGLRDALEHLLDVPLGDSAARPAPSLTQDSTHSAAEDPAEGSASPWRLIDSRP